MTQHDTSEGGRRGGLFWLVLAAAVVGVVLVAVGIATQHPDAPELDGPVGSVGRESSSSAPNPESSGPPEVEPADKVPLAPSEPVHVTIPAIGVDSEVFPLGKAPDGTLAVPQPGPNLDKAAWFENSPTPGQPGPSIIEGHVATDEGGPSVFYDLADLRPGDTIAVAREDGSRVVFEVTGLREFPKDQFPTSLVYGGDLAKPTLRLITCSNFDPSIGHHTANLVVFSELKKVVKG